MPVKGSRQCGAKCRTKEGAPCLQPAMRGSNRCRMHFGHARKLKTHGRLTKQAGEDRHQQQTLLKEMIATNQEIRRAINENNNNASKKEKKRVKNIAEVRRKLELWDKMERGDEDALIEISIERGMATKEDFPDKYPCNKKRVRFKPIT